MHRSRHSHRRLAVLRLPVDASFAGEAVVGADRPLLKPDDFDDKVDAGTHGGVREREEPGAESACRACSGDCVHAATGIATDDLRIVAQGPVELFDHGGRRAFLRPEDRRCAVGAGQRDGDVAGQYNRRARNARGRDRCNRCGRGRRAPLPRPAGCDRLAVEPIGRREPGPCLRRRHWVALAAESDDDAFRAMAERVEDQFSDAARGGVQRVGRRCRRGAVPRLRPFR